MQLELKHLRVLLAVAEAGSIASAAVQLRIARPPLVAQVHRIEAELGGVIFERTPSGITPTEFGRYVLKRGRDQIDHFDHLCLQARSMAMKAGDGTPVPLGTTLPRLAPALLRSARHVIAGATPTVRLAATSEDLAALLASREISIATLHEWADFPVILGADVRQLAIVEEPMLLGLARDHLLSQRDVISIDELADESWVSAGPFDTVGSVQLRLVCEAAGFAPHVHHVGTDSLMRQEMVVAGYGIGLFPPSEVQLSDLLLKRLAGNPCCRTLSLAWVNEPHIDVAITDLAPLLVTAHRALMEEILGHRFAPLSAFEEDYGVVDVTPQLARQA